MATLKFPLDPVPDNMINGLQIQTFDSTGKSGNNPTNTIQLYLPAQPKESVNAVYNKDDGKLIKAALAAQQGDFTGAFSIFGEKAAESRIGEFLGQRGGIFGGFTGNPTLTYTFKTIDQRVYNFSFNMLAKSPSESNAIKDICDALREASLPTRNDSNSAFVLAYPDYVKLQYLRDDYLHKFSDCIIQTVDITYSSAGGDKYMEFDSGAPLGVQLDVVFEEVTLPVRGTYKSGTSSPGFFGLGG